MIFDNLFSEMYRTTFAVFYIHNKRERWGSERRLRNRQKKALPLITASRYGIALTSANVISPLFFAYTSYIS